MTTTTTTTRTAVAVTPSRAPSVAGSLAPLALDVAVPFGVYLLARHLLGVGLVPALVLGSVVPAVRSVVGLVRDRAVNGLAVLVLAVNLIGIVLAFVDGDARVLFLKDSGVSSVAAIGILVSTLRGRPLMSEALEPFVTRGVPDRAAAWARLTAGSARFRRLERRFSAVWGLALLAECVTRAVCAVTAPLSVLTWLSPVLLVAAVGFAMVVGGAWASAPMVGLVDAEVDAVVDAERASASTVPGGAAAQPVRLIRTVVDQVS